MFISVGDSISRRCAGLFGALSLFAAAATAQGQTTINWNNPAGGSYHTAANWNPANVPNTATETARFDLDAAMTISFNAGSNTTIDDLQVFRGDLIFRNAGVNNDATLNISDDARLSGGNLTLTRLPGGTADVNLVIAGLLEVEIESELNILNSARVQSGTGVVGNDIGDLVTVVVSGAGSTWTSGGIFVAFEGEGTLRIEEGGSVVSHTDIIGYFQSSGSVIVNGTDGDGNPSTWSSVDLVVGRGGSGTLTIEAGGRVSTQITRIGGPLSGIGANSIGSVTVTGSDGNGNASTWVNSSFIEVGRFGQGTLTIEDGGIVSGNFGTLGTAAGATGEATVTGAGSTWTNTGDLQVGVAGAGTLNVLDSAVVEAANINIHATNGTLNWDTQGTLRINGGTITGLHDVDNNISIGSAGGQNLELTSGATLSNANGYLGNLAGTSGAVTVSGTDGIGNASTWTSDFNLVVGNSGSGTLTIEAGGSVSNTTGFIATNTNSTGSVTVSGTDGNGNASTWNNSGSLTVGTSGTGTLTIDAGGRVVSNIIGTIGNNSGSSGTVTVTGAASNWTNSGELHVGGLGTGTLTIEQGGSVSNTIGIISAGTNSSGAATVTGADSTWTNSNALYVGLRGSGMLTIEDGGAVSGVNGFIGFLSGSTGTVMLEGAGSTWTNSGSLFVGGSQTSAGGAGTLTIAGEAQVTTTAVTKIWGPGTVRLHGGKLTTGELVDGAGAFEWLSGTLRLTGSGGLTIGAAGYFGSTLLLNENQTLEIDNALTVEPGGKLFLDAGGHAGSVDIDSGAQMFVGGAMQQFGAGLTNSGQLVFSDSTVVEGPVTNAAGGAITALGDVTFNDLVDGPGGFYGPGTITFAGGMSPGASPADVSFEGNVAFGDGNTLLIELGGTMRGSQHDALDIAGTATLSGTLDASLINSFIPSAGDEFEILTAAAGISGTFASTMLPTLAGDLFWNVSYGSTSVVLEVAAPSLPGDYNQNGTVDAADYVVWRKNDGTMNTLPNDPIGGEIGPAHYIQWRANFGSTSGSGALSNAIVPEPATLAMLLIGALAMLSRRPAR